MKVARRGFLGLMGGAAAAGPKLAKGMAESVDYDIKEWNVFHSAIPKGGPVEDEYEYRQAAIKRLQGIIAGDDPDGDRRRAQLTINAAGSQERFRLDSLRSVSPTYKHRMYVSGEYQRHLRQRQLEAKFDLMGWLSERIR